MHRKMDKLWIIIVALTLVLRNHEINGQSEVEVQLLVRKYVEKGSVVTLKCDHNVKPEILYKVTWLKNGLGKFFEYINGRNPPFRNFTIPGAEIDWSNSNAEKVTLRTLDFEASGLYYCEVSTDTPIFTKASEDEQLHVILPQTGPPKISFSKRQFFIGEKLVANCTTTKARPSPHITWLINGKKVDEKYTKTLHPYPTGGKGSHRSKSHQQNNPSYDKSDTGELYSSKSAVLPPSASRDEPLDPNGNNMGFEIHPNSGYSYDNIFDTTGNINGVSSHSDIVEHTHETSQDFYDNKYFDTKKHRNTYSRKYRRYVNDGGNRISHKAQVSSSQLSIEVSELHAGINGRLEITCLATIPAHVGPGEQFADYKTYSVKIDIEAAETTSLVPSMSGMAALGNAANNKSSSLHNTINQHTVVLLCFLIITLLILRN